MSMRKYPWIVAASSLLLVSVPWACGGGASNSGPGGGFTTTSTTHTSVTTGTPTGCMGLLAPGDCTTCLEGSCCQQLSDCNNDANCLDCATGSAADPTVCNDPNTTALLNALLMCQDQSCKVPCTPPPPPDPTCNPITNQGCADGEACDFVFDQNGQGSFKCYGAPAPTEKQCAMCDDQNTACLPGFTCLGTCAKFCCSDSECGSHTCNFMNGAFGVGICADDQLNPWCDAPAGWTSMGSCLMGFDAGTPPLPDAGSDAAANDSGSDAAAADDGGSDAGTDDGGGMDAGTSDAGDAGP
jgi:hypothetical protein